MTMLRTSAGDRGRKALEFEFGGFKGAVFSTGSHPPPRHESPAEDVQSFPLFPPSAASAFLIMEGLRKLRGRIERTGCWLGPQTFGGVARPVNSASSLVSSWMRSLGIS